MKQKKNLSIEIRQQDDGGWIVGFKTGLLKNEKVVAEELDSLKEKVSQKINDHYAR